MGLLVSKLFLFFYLRINATVFHCEEGVFKQIFFITYSYNITENSKKY
jgi:hypothetical protein